MREAVMPGYMALVKQIDGLARRPVRLPGAARPDGHDDDVFTSDHGDYLGDHWMGEKDLFHEQVIGCR